MPNRTLTSDIIAAEALMILDNNLVMANQVFRAEDEFSKTVSGYKPGDTINMRRPTDFEVREGAQAAVQDVVEGKVPLVVDTQAGVDFQFTSKDLTLNIKDLSSRVIKPAMVQLANFVDGKLMDLYKAVPNWVGTPGQLDVRIKEMELMAAQAAAGERLEDLQAQLNQVVAAINGVLESAIPHRGLPGVSPFPSGGPSYLTSNIVGGLRGLGRIDSRGQGAKSNVRDGSSLPITGPPNGPGSPA